jgi:heme/copper-type cytochrome/quinol oxidase subunit 1
VTRLPPARTSISLLWLLAAGIFVAAEVLLQIHPIKPGGDLAAFYILRHPIFTIGIPAVFCVFAAAYFALQRTPKARLNRSLGHLQLALTVLGAGLIEVPGFALGWVGQPNPHDARLAAFAFWSRFAAAGYAVLLAGMLLFAYVLIDSFRRKA